MRKGNRRQCEEKEHHVTYEDESQETTERTYQKFKNSKSPESGTVLNEKEGSGKVGQDTILRYTVNGQNTRSVYSEDSQIVALSGKGEVIEYP